MIYNNKMGFLTNNFIPFSYRKREKLTKIKSTVFFVGLSHTMNKDGSILEAFCESTNSGKIIKKITENIPDGLIYKTNLVKGVPLDNNGKIRYPTFKEKQEGLENLKKEINEINPTFVFLFGRQVYDFVIKNLSTYKINDYEYKYKNSILIFQFHPSYIGIYKRRCLEEYINNILERIQIKRIHIQKN